MSPTVRLEGFEAGQEEMIGRALQALARVGYDMGPLHGILRSELTPGRRGMTLTLDEIVLSDAAFASQDLLNCVLEEELLHLHQKARDPNSLFHRRTCQEWEADINAQRQFPLPES